MKTRPKFICRSSSFLIKQSAIYIEIHINKIVLFGFSPSDVVVIACKYYDIFSPLSDPLYNVDKPPRKKFETIVSQFHVRQTGVERFTCSSICPDLLDWVSGTLNID